MELSASVPPSHSNSIAERESKPLLNSIHMQRGVTFRIGWQISQYCLVSILWLFSSIVLMFLYAAPRKVSAQMNDHFKH